MKETSECCTEFVESWCLSCFIYVWHTHFTHLQVLMPYFQSQWSTSWHKTFSNIPAKNPSAHFPPKHSSHLITIWFAGHIYLISAYQALIYTKPISALILTLILRLGKKITFIHCRNGYNFFAKKLIYN